MWLELILTVSYQVWGSTMLTADEARKLNPFIGIEQEVKKAALHGYDFTVFKFPTNYYEEGDIDPIKSMLIHNGYKVDLSSVYGDNKQAEFILRIDWGE